MNRSKPLLAIVAIIAVVAFVWWNFLRGLSPDPDSSEAIADIHLLRSTLSPDIPAKPCKAMKLPGVIKRPESQIGRSFEISVDGDKLQCKEGTYTRSEDGTWTFAAFVPQKSLEEIGREIDEESMGKELSDLAHQFDDPRKKTYLNLDKDKTQYVYQEPTMWPGNFKTSEREFRSMAKYSHLALYNDDSKLVAAFPYLSDEHTNWYFHPNLPVMFFATREHLAIWDLYSFKEIAHIDAVGDKQFYVQSSFTPEASIIAVAQDDEIHFWHITPE